MDHRRQKVYAGRARFGGRCGAEWGVWRRRAVCASVGLGALVATGAGRHVAGARAAERFSGPSVRAVAPDSTAGAKQWIEMRNVDLRLTDSVVLHVRSLHGEVRRTKPERVAALDDATSFQIRVTAGTVALTGADLGALLNTVVFAYRGAPLRDIRVRTDSVQIVQTGILHKGVDVRFRLRGILSLTPEGLVRIHPTELRILGLNGQKVMQMLGLHLDGLLDLRGARGATVKGNDLFLDPTAILPPPAIDGRLSGIRVEGSEVVQDFVRLPEDLTFAAHVPPDSSDKNFIYFRGGELRFGKLLMNDTDLRIVDAEPKTPFDMSLPHYSRQLVAGYSRTRQSGGLTVYMPDFATLEARDSTVHAAKH